MLLFDETPDHGDGDLPPLPPHATAGEALVRALPTLSPPHRIGVEQAAVEHRQVNAGGHWVEWRNDVAPYMVEPMRQITSRQFSVVAFAGPARCVKTAALIENSVAHAIMCNPRTTHIVQMSQMAAREYSIEKIDPMVRNSPDLAERAATGKGANNTYDKRFRGGMRLTIGWPVVQSLSSRDIPLVLMTDYDRMPLDLGGEGSPFALARKRPQTFGSLGKVVVEGSPGRPVLDEAWKPKTLHDVPPCTGILSIVSNGTRGRYYWFCRDCSGRFEPRMERLDYPKDAASPAAAGAKAVMICPDCGSVIEAKHKPEMNAGGLWLHEAADGESLVEIGDTALRETDIASYWLHGPAAVFAPWHEIVTRYEQANATFEGTGDETELKTAVNTDWGLPYLPRARSAHGQITEQGLKEVAGDRPAGIAPEGTRFITVQADVQANRFVVQVDAWGQDLERWMIDRFDIHEPPEGAPGADKRAIDPARFAEDWEALTPLLSRSWPVAGSGVALRPVGLAVDSHGATGVTDKAYAWYRERRKAGVQSLCHLIRGRGGLKITFRAEIAYPKAPGRGKSVAADVPLLNVATDYLKDEIAASLRREIGGQRAFHLTSTLPPEIFAELAAERRGEKGWEMRAGQKRNEALDLSVYGLGLVIVLRAENIDWDRPPAWAAPMERNSFAVPLANDDDQAEQGPAPKPKRRRGGLRASAALRSS